jgi:hypothetical protein
MEIPAQVPPERNAEVHANHRRQVQRQIYLPIILVVLVVLAGVAAIIIYGFRVESTLRRWADVSLIWMIMIAMFFGLILMIVAMGSLYAVTRLHGVIPGYTHIVQGYFRQAEAKVLQITNGLVAPILGIRSNWSVIKHRDRILDKQTKQQ